MFSSLTFPKKINRKSIEVKRQIQNIIKVMGKLLNENIIKKYR